MSDAELITKYKGTRNVYMRSISSCERDSLRIIDIYKSDDESHITKLLSAKLSLQEKLNKVRELDENILQLLTQNDSETELEQILIRDDKINELLVKIDRCVSKPSNEGSIRQYTPSPIPQVPINEVKVKLPQLEMPKFDGDIINFQGFWDQFQSAIHSNNAISDIDKFSYLKSFLCDSAKGCISGLSLSSANYYEALELLKQRYGNPQMLINAYMKRFVQLPMIKNNNDIIGLRQLYDQVESSVRNLKSLAVDTSGYGSLLVPLLIEKLPFSLRQCIARKFENDIWDLTEMLRILKSELESRERSVTVGGSFNNDKPQSRYSSAALYSGYETVQKKCIFCNEKHSANRCLKITDTHARKRFLSSNGLCFVCFDKNHLASACKANYSCNKCKGRHHISICTFSKPRSNPPQDVPQDNQPSTPSQPPIKQPQVTSNNFSSNKNNVLLQTATAPVSNLNKNSQFEDVQILFDSGSQRSYVSNSLCKRLKLPILRTERIVIKTFGNEQFEAQNVNVVLLKFLAGDKIVFIEALCSPVICAGLTNQNSNFASKQYNHLKNLHLADKSVDGNKEIEILIGLDYYYQFIMGKVIKGNIGEPIAIDSCFGWILSGQYKNHSFVNFNETYFLKISTEIEENFEGVASANLSNSYVNKNVINQFLNSEQLYNFSKEESNSFNEFQNNLKYNGSRYEVKLPFINLNQLVPDNYLLSKIRTEQLLKRLQENKTLLKSYDDIIKDYLVNGIVEEANNIPEVGYTNYLPHRAVIRNDKETTKVRIVYDASARFKNEPSLNDFLDPGPCLLPFLFDILLRFRTGKIALISDIKQAFLQIEIAPEHRDFLRFLWYDDVYKSDPEFISLRFTRVMFGLTCSPSLLSRTIKAHLEKYLKFDDIKLYIEKLLRNLYVDDSVNSFDSINDCITFYNVAKSSLIDAGFELRKWKSNDLRLNEYIKSSQTNTVSDNSLADDSSYTQNEFGIYSNSFTTVLGLNWDIANDNFVFDFIDIYSAALKLPPTKRNILKISATFFDPLGCLVPITLPSKILFKDLCIRKINWDNDIPIEFKKRWKIYLDELKTLQLVSVNRHVLCCECRDVEIHGFCDSSEQAYCAAVYVRVNCVHGVKVKFWAGKGRLAPMRKLTIPRLELLACMLLSELIDSVVDAVKSDVRVTSIFCWTDSQIAVWWIKQCGKIWNVWVQNRVEKIRKLISPEKWYFVPTNTNPADIGTRPKSLDNINFDFWLSGPKYLLENSDCWPSQSFALSEREAKLEERVAKTTVLSVVTDWGGVGKVVNCLKYSSMDKLLRVTSYVLRFIYNIRKKLKHETDERIGEISTEEINFSQKLWIKYEQLFIVGSSKFDKVKNSLKLFYDENQILRLDTRISNYENFNFDKKFPVLLQSDSHFTKLIILKIHEQNLHCGVSSTLAIIRSNYWLIRGRQTVRKFLKGCVICKFVQGKTMLAPETPKLPSFRVSCNHSFENVGVDYAGPLYHKELFNNTVTMSKCYILLFTCAVTRAVHIELTPDMGAHSLILALRRFISRKGTVKLIISDNFKSFKSALLKSYLRNHNISWKFILEKSPWWGGFYERLVGLVKNLLKKAMGRARFTYDELFTLLVEVENVLNSRPLTYVSESQDESFISPYHLLYGRYPSEKCFDFAEKDIYGNDVREIYTKLQDVKSYFIKKFESEYIVALQERAFYNNKKFDNSERLVINDIVLVKEENVPRMSWRKGRIVRLIKGSDGRVRGAELKVQQHNSDKIISLQRPLQYLIPFEIVDQKNNENTENTNSEQTDNTETLATPRNRPKRIAASNADAIRRINDDIYNTSDNDE